MVVCKSPGLCPPQMSSWCVRVNRTGFAGRTGGYVWWQRLLWRFFLFLLLLWERWGCLVSLKNLLPPPWLSSGKGGRGSSFQPGGLYLCPEEPAGVQPLVLDPRSLAPLSWFVSGEVLLAGLFLKYIAWRWKPECVQDLGSSPCPCSFQVRTVSYWHLSPCLPNSLLQRAVPGCWVPSPALPLRLHPLLLPFTAACPPPTHCLAHSSSSSLWEDSTLTQVFSPPRSSSSFPSPQHPHSPRL